MSKSIYEEAIEIMMNSILPRESNKTNKLKVIKAIKKAQKQEKLLELYKGLANTLEVIDNAYGYEIFEFGEIKYICNKIKKELENDI